MERYTVHHEYLMPYEQGNVVLYADAQATVEALQARVKELEANRVPNSMQHVIELQAALDAEREKLSNRCMCEHEWDDEGQLLTLSECKYHADRSTQLSQLQALVRALPKCEGLVSAIQAATDGWHIYDGIFTTEESAHAYAALLTHRATLDATTPATKGGNGE